jgi:hypothetical protein
MSTLQRPVLLLTYLIEASAALSLVYTVEACSAPGDVYTSVKSPSCTMDNRSVCLCCSCTYLHYRGLYFSWRCLHYTIANGPELLLDNRTFAAPGFIFTTEDCAFGSVYTAEVCGAPGGVYFTNFIAQGLELLLEYRSMCCSWSYLHYSTEVCATFGGICTAEPCASPAVVWTTVACAAPGLIYNTGTCNTLGSVYTLGPEFHM